MPDGLATAHRYPGKLFIVEGIDGSGKSTQIHLLERWLISMGYSVFFTEWNSAELVTRQPSEARKKRILTPTTFSLRCTHGFCPSTGQQHSAAAQGGAWSCWPIDMCLQPSRDHVRGCDPEWVRKVYRFAPRPDVAFYFRVPIETALRRITMARPMLKDFEAGMDLNLHTDPFESFKLFQGRILAEYDRMAPENDFEVIDATGSIAEQQRQVRSVVLSQMERYQRKPRIA
jgi:dTMP kinase